MIDIDSIMYIVKAKQEDGSKLKRKSCCCGATEETPCVCMLKGIMQCSAVEPKCPCYSLLDKQKKKASEISKMIAVR